MSTSRNVVVFACNWDGLSCLEAAAHDGLCYPASVRAVRVSCLSRVHLGLILKAFELGACGVMLLGCEAGECHYGANIKKAVQECEKARGVLRLMGIEPAKVAFTSMPRGDGAGFVEKIEEFVKQVGGQSLSIPAEVGKKKHEPPPLWRFRIEG